MFKNLKHKTFEVGGSIRNELLGLPPNDIDFCVVATEEEFELEFPEAKRVGNTFPVYLLDGCEVALTRKEVSVGSKYQDFEVKEVGVSIEEDLLRRDFTLNSICKNVATGELLDPHNGIHDIKERIIRTINDNFVKDDPLRVYRLARFAAEFDFNIEKKTTEIVRRDAKYITNVLPERIYLELKKNYERSAQPSIFFRVLQYLDILHIHFEPLFRGLTIPAGPVKWHGNDSVTDHLLTSFDKAKQFGYSFDVALAALFHDLGKIVTPKDILPKHHGHEARHYNITKDFLNNHRFTEHQQKLTLQVGKLHMKFHELQKMKPTTLVRFFKEIKQNLEEIIQACNCDSELTTDDYFVLERLERTYKETVIDIPKEIHSRGREAVKNFVEAKYVQKYKELS